MGCWPLGANVRIFAKLCVCEGCGCSLPKPQAGPVGKWGTRGGLGSGREYQADRGAMAVLGGCTKAHMLVNLETVVCMPALVWGLSALVSHVSPVCGCC